MNRDQWLAERRSGIGASECAAVLGLSKWAGPLDVYNSKLGISPDLEESEAMKWGKRLEPFVAQEFHARHPEYALQRPPEFYIVRHRELPFVFCTPDYWLNGCEGNQDSGLQIKTVGANAVRYWPEDNAPDAYLCQCIHEMACHVNRDVWFLDALVGGQTEREYRIVRDLPLEREIMSRLSQFWENHVIPQIPPPMDATDASDRLLRHLYPQAGQYVRNAEPEEFDFWDNVGAQRNVYEAAKRRWEEISNQAKERIGLDKGVQWPQGRAIWSSVKGRTSINYKELIEHLGVPDEVIQRFTTVGAPTRRFTVTIGEDVGTNVE